NARRRLEAEAADRAERRLNVTGALCWNADGPCRLRNHGGREAFLLMRDGHRHDPAGKPREISQKTLAVLGRKHSNHEHEWAGDSLLEIGKRIGNGASALRIMAAIEPQFASQRAKRGQLPLRETLHARRPISLSNAGLERTGR